jgi:hypothetical protein
MIIRLILVPSIKLVEQRHLNSSSKHIRRSPMCFFLANNSKKKHSPKIDVKNPFSLPQKPPKYKRKSLAKPGMVIKRSEIRQKLP